MAVDRPVYDVDDFAQLTYQTRTSSVSADIFNALGAKPTTGDVADFRDTTLPRYGADTRAHQTHAVKTNHAMYLTTILANDEMMQAMSEDHRTAFRESAKVAAHAERIKSVQDADEISTSKTLQQSLNIEQMIELDASQHTKLREKLVPVLNKWKAYFPNGLVDRIQAA